MANQEYTVISEISLSVAGSFSFSDIPQTYVGLLLRLQLHGTTNAGLVLARIQFNGDTTDANYRQQIAYGSLQFGVRGVTYPEIRVPADAGGTTTDDSAVHSGKMYIWGYASSVYKKHVLGEYVANYEAETAQDGGIYHLSWNNTNAITSIVIATPSDNFKAGSWVQLLGIS